MSATACRRCREQKLRCSREQPECVRCSRLGANCTYPSPPDRKLLASVRASSRKAQRTQKRAELSTPSAVKVANLEAAVTEIDTTQDGTTTQPNDGILPDRNVQRLLIDLYFACMFNATLTLHPSTFVRKWEQGKLPHFLVQAVCALGTNFLASPTAVIKRNGVTIPSVQSLKASARSWALSAGREVLQSIDQPKMEGIQTCLVLTLYWFANGDPSRDAMFSGIAYRALRTLWSKTKRQTLVRNESDAVAWLESEQLHRCFWAAWIVNTISSDHYIIGASADSYLREIPLPATSTSFNNVVPGSWTRLSDPDTQVRLSSVNNESDDVALMAELVKMVLNWAKLRDHIEARKQSPTRVDLSGFFALDQMLSKWVSGLPTTFVYSKRNLYEQLVVRQQPSYTVVHALFHQCRLVLHSSIVPQFSGLPLQESVPLELVRTSARVALESAQAISELGADILALDWDPAQFAPFVGYCMYVAASIHISFIRSADDKLAIRARSHLLSSLKILKVMSPFWANLEKLWQRAHILYENESQRIIAASDAKTMSSAASQPSRHAVDQVALIKREAGELTEPLADSVLEYGILRIQNNVRQCDGPLPFPELEREMQIDSMARLTAHDAAQAQQPSLSTESPVEQTQPVSQEIAKLNFDEFCLQDVSSIDFDAYDQQGGPLDLDTEWWEPNMEFFPSAVSLYDDLFGSGAMTMT